MAVLALGFLGTAIGGGIGGSILGVTVASIGGFIGSAIGGVLDQILFAQKQQGPRITDLSVQTSTYGTTIPLPYGPENRYACNVIWSTGLIEHHHTEGGKFGFGGTEVYTYTVSFAVLLSGRPIEGISKIWANGKVLYDAAMAPADSGSQSQFGDDGFIGDIFAFLQSFGQSQVAYDSMAVYRGTFDQMPDPTIEAALGVGNVNGYRGSAYIVVKDLQLADYGDRLPNLEFLVVADGKISVGAVALDICARCKINPNTVSTSDLTFPLRGYVIGNDSSGTAAMQPLGLAFNFDTAEVAGGLRCISRDSSVRAIIPLSDLGAHAVTDDYVEPITWSRSPTVGLPRQAIVTFKDPDRDYQPNSQMSQRSEGTAANNLATALPLTLDVDTGRQIADRMLWEAWTGLQTATASTDDRWSVIEAGQRYLFETPAGLEPLRITRRTRGANGVIDLELRRDRAEVYESTMSGANGNIPPNQLKVPGPTELLLLDIPIMRDADDNSGFYFGVVGSGTGWRGADVIRALTADGDYSEVAPLGIEARVATIAGTIPDGPTYGYDDTTVLIVTLRHDTQSLTSATDDQLEQGFVNVAFIGNEADTTQGEIIQYGVANLIGPGIYHLSHIRRGRYGTEFAAPLHAANEIFVALELGVFNRADFGVPDLDLERAYKGVSLPLPAADADAILFTNTGVGLRPYSPVALTVDSHSEHELESGMSGGGGDLLLAWQRRSRLQSGALGEETELYAVRILNGAGATVRETTSTVQTFVYTTADQVADFGSTVTHLRWRVAQVSAVYGNGIFEEFDGPVGP